MPTLKFKEYSLDIPENIYFPSEDTELLLSVLEDEIISKNKKYSTAIEIGTGNGLLSLAVYKNVNVIYSTDINPIVIDYLLNVKEKYNLFKLKITMCSLFEGFLNVFDLIIFNPPYVPTDEIGKINIDLAVDGGKNGREIIDEFITQLPKFLSNTGVCFLLVSSLNNLEEITFNLKQNKLQSKIISSKKLFFEELHVLKINW